MNKEIIICVKNFVHDNKEKKCKYYTWKLKCKTNLSLNPPHPQAVAVTEMVAATRLQ